MLVVDRSGSVQLPPGHGSGASTARRRGRTPNCDGQLVAPQDALLPHTYRPGEACRSEETSVRAERDAKDGAAVAGAQCRDQVVALHAQQRDRPVVAVSGGEGPPVGTERDATDEMVGQERLPERVEATHVPQHDRPVNVRGGEAEAIGPKSDATDGARVIVERPEPGVMSQVPQHDRPVRAGGGERPAIATERA